MACHTSLLLQRMAVARRRRLAGRSALLHSSAVSSTRVRDIISLMCFGLAKVEQREASVL